jgi:phosphoglycolate phosphatase
MNVINTIIFDFDGTIADSFQKTFEVIIKLAKKYGFGREVKERDIKLYKSKDVKEIIKEVNIPVFKLPFLINKGQHELNKEIGNIEPFGGMISVISELKNGGFILGILTSNSESNVKQFLKNNKIDIFDFIYSGTGLLGKGIMLKKLIKNENIEIDKTVYVGDETRDIRAAHETGIRAVAVTWGFNTKEPLLKEKPDWIVGKPEQLLKIFASEK